MGVILVANSALVSSQETSDDPSAGPTNDNQKVLAWVGQRSIKVADVNFHLGRDPNQDLPNLARAARENAVHLIASQVQALQTMRQLRIAASGEEVDSWLDKNLVGSTSGDDLESRIEALVSRYGAQPETLIDQAAFRLSWQSYLAKHLSERNIERHFTNQQERFDGTEFQVWLVSAPSRAGASGLRDEIATKMGKVFSGAGVELKQLEERTRELGWEYQSSTWIRGTGALPRGLVSAVLELKPGQVSQPVHSAAGVHVIGLMDRKDGDWAVEQVRDEVRADMLVFLLEHLAAQSADQLPLRVAQ